MNRERRKEAGKVILDLSKYLATTVAVGTIFAKESVDWMAAIIGGIFALALFITGIKTVPPDKEE